MENEETRTLFLCDGHDTAGPIIEQLRLKRDTSFPSLTCFASPAACLIESRGGRVAAATAAAFLLGRLRIGPATRLFHLGPAALLHARGGIEPSDETPGGPSRGAQGKVLPQPALPEGSLVLAHRIVEEGTGRAYLPDILFRHSLPEGTVLTNETRWGRLMAGDRSPLEGADPGAQLVDRELSGFCAAALTFLAPHQIFCLCAVVGPESGGPRSGEVIGEVVGDHLDALEAIIEASREVCVPEPPLLDEDTAQVVERAAALLRLTVAEREILKSAAEGYLVRRGGPLPSLPARSVGSARERSELFERIRRTLTESG